TKSASVDENIHQLMRFFCLWIILPQRITAFSAASSPLGCLFLCMRFCNSVTSFLRTEKALGKFWRTYKNMT
ncbi:hypothetical protein LIQ52_09095, partial [Mitsuokella jalaludinii]|uniref:hypothetical protein n=1 Tax=Mitsuokella jalaludinii TaxID=187979 RepID=UPI001D01294C